MTKNFFDLGKECRYFDIKKGEIFYCDDGYIAMKCFGLYCLFLSVDSEYCPGMFVKGYDLLGKETPIATTWAKFHKLSKKIQSLFLE